MLGAEALGGGTEPCWGLLQHLTDDEDAADAVADLQPRNLVPNDQIGRVGLSQRHQVESVVAHQPIDAPTLVFQLTHRLLERTALHTDEVLHRHPHVGEEHLAEVAVGGHVLDRANFDAGRVHRHDDLADARVRRAFLRRTADEVAVVADGAEARPDLLPVDHEPLAIALGGRLETGEVAARVRLAHPDAPRGVAGDDAG